MNQVEYAELLTLLASMTKQLSALAEHVAAQGDLLITLSKLTQANSDALLLHNEQYMMRYLSVEEIMLAEASGMVVNSDTLVPVKSSMGFQ